MGMSISCGLLMGAYLLFSSRVRGLNLVLPILLQYISVLQHEVFLSSVIPSSCTEQGKSGSSDATADSKFVLVLGNWWVKLSCELYQEP